VALAAGELAFVVAFGFGPYQLAIGYDDRFAFGLPRWFQLVLATPYLLVALTATCAYLLIASRGRRDRSRTAPILSIAASVVLLVIAWAWSVPAP
jgi:hypothetical protein